MNTNVIERAIEHAQDEVRYAMSLEISKKGYENAIGLHENDKDYSLSVATLRRIYDKLEEALNELPF